MCPCLSTTRPETLPIAEALDPWAAGDPLIRHGWAGRGVTTTNPVRRHLVQQAPFARASSPCHRLRHALLEGKGDRAEVADLDQVAVSEHRRRVN